MSAVRMSIGPISPPEKKNQHSTVPIPCKPSCKRQWTPFVIKKPLCFLYFFTAQMECSRFVNGCVFVHLGQISHRRGGVRTPTLTHGSLLGHQFASATFRCGIVRSQHSGGTKYWAATHPPSREDERGRHARRYANGHSTVQGKAGGGVPGDADKWGRGQ